MVSARPAPGPDADYAFRFGVVASVVVALGVLALLYWSGVVGLVGAGYILLAIFPVYLLLVAAVLSVWLGFDKDETALRPVYQEEESRSK